MTSEQPLIDPARTVCLCDVGRKPDLSDALLAEAASFQPAELGEEALVRDDYGLGR